MHDTDTIVQHGAIRSLCRSTGTGSKEARFGGCSKCMAVACNTLSLDSNVNYSYVCFVCR